MCILDTLLSLKKPTKENVGGEINERKRFNNSCVIYSQNSSYRILYPFPDSCKRFCLASSSFFLRSSLALMMSVSLSSLGWLSLSFCTSSGD